MVLTFDQVGETLDEMAERFPQALFDGLNGGVSLLEDTVPDPEFPEGEMYILGEYCDDLLGRYINLYYGSFAALAEREDWDEQVWQEELRITLSHELTHHMEARGGLHSLDDRDAEELAAWREEYGLDCG
ncbi:metallopeptidase family protein [Dysosmobacter sp.]|uniref:metallopeptidase family protein n=1 Tax=Dysosmobacter sp. TaxID=2591382 RepID=UPI002A9F4558|nr:metallopeptidase family protein [Dysosmobacter sp.]MDY5611682.1 metallopeptidase family protein [Dysosmobacter sp.]